MPVSFIDPGQFTARLELEAPVAVPDGQGGADVRYEGVAAFWAMVEPAGHAVREAAGAETATLTHRIWVRFRTDISAGMRLRKGARLFAVRAVIDPDETQRYLVCHCEEEGP
ncbi:head-tail adaptor protein [Metarhizobium album]|uniref:Head-tail adaptor protein n=1 Tax=Metarhizobium album TaxID=2182425 RepID=A0A2U2DXY7_9HYPH|nr:phage head closure protein [Rhizobium album]PWE58183.1 head-tail adaptor protein [Rhizobium album]